jgi:4-hydroxy-tetrahydrodipicolinate synthase
MTALITPFGDDGGVDVAALERLAAWQVERGIHALVPCGTTGEGATLTDDEQRRVIEVVVAAARGRVPVIAGCGTNDTRRTLEAAERVARAGADGLLVVSPYYNRPNRSGMIAHYEAVARATALPVVVYNVPGRTGQNLGVELILELAAIPGVVAVKEAAGNLEQLALILAGRPSGFGVLSGDDALAMPAMALGADGVISVVSNEAPAEMAALVEAMRAGALDPARELHFRLLPLISANFCESNPVPVKTAMALLGFCGERVRPPLGPPTAATREAIERALGAARLEGARR